MIQNSSEWLGWRNKGIGSSDIPIILGLSKYATPYQLWEQKTNRVKKEDKPSFVAELGHKFEERIRAEFELKTGLDFPPTCVEHDDNDKFRASLDGYNEETNQFLEIKYIGEDRMQWVKDNQRPLPDHEPQTDWQFLLTNATYGHYICYTLTKDRKQIKEVHTVKIVQSVARIMHEVLPAAQAFLTCMETDTPPPKTEKDEYNVRDVELNNKSIELAKLIAQRKEITDKMSALENDLKEYADKKGSLKTIFKGCQISKVYRKGSVDYKKIPQLIGVDLDQYRGKDVVSFQVRSL